MTVWIQVLVAMVDGPATPVQGIVRPYRPTDDPIHVYYATHGEDPVLLCLPAEGVHGLGDGVQPVGFFETEPCGVADFGFAARYGGDGSDGRD